jgi:hypothetical protein
VLEAGLPRDSSSRHRFTSGLLPLLWLIPYLAYAIVILILIAMLTGS